MTRRREYLSSVCLNGMWVHPGNVMGNGHDLVCADCQQNDWQRRYGEDLFTWAELAALKREQAAPKSARRRWPHRRPAR